jgi:hypothetical protein
MNDNALFDELQIEACTAVTKALEAATTCIETEDFSGADYEIHIATNLLKDLQSLQRQIRSLSKDGLATEIQYFDTWLLAVVGHCGVAKKQGSAVISRFILERARRQSKALVKKYPYAPKFRELAELIDGWLAPFKRTQD